MLKVNSLNQYYGGSHILRDLSFEIPAGKVTALLGRNGVGKTTLLKSLMGVVAVKSGRITLDANASNWTAPPRSTRASPIARALTSSARNSRMRSDARNSRLRSVST